VARLLVVYTPATGGDGITRAVGSGGLTIHRRGSDEGLELDDPEVSRMHARVTRDAGGDGYRIEDLDSRNGTFVNAKQIREHALESGDVIRVGSHLLLFELLDLEAVQHLPLKRQVGESLVGECHALSRVREEIQRVAPLRIPVLVLGETGVGKERVAVELHRQSGRDGLLVPVNCAALPTHLAESELFGHVRGAFTGAAEASAGLFGEAHAGTLLLDEIGDMSLDLQSKLLRVLATGEVRRIGAATTEIVDVRVIAATNVDLRHAVDAGNFRADLYSRLMGAVIDVPPLRERRDDVLRLAHHFIGDEPIALTADAAEALLVYGWPFNVRELGQVIGACASDARRAGTLDVEHLPTEIAAPLIARQAPLASQSMEAPLWMRVKRDATPSADELRLVVAHYDGNIHHIAEFFEKDRRQIYRWLERHDIDIGAFRPEEA
jgi:transcriptional regulator with GAF, ATPase, and Fis domain